MIKSYCKINLFLKVLKKNNSGLHSIQSTVMLLDLHDKISIKRIKKKKIKLYLLDPLKETLKKIQIQ